MHSDRAPAAYDPIVPVQVEWVRYGREGAEALRATIAAIKGEEPLAPVTVVVSSNHVGVATRRLLASGALGPVSSRGVGLAAVTFATPYRLAELLGAPVLAAAGRRPVSTPVIAAALRSALRADAGLFAPVAEHPATETALVAAYRELRDLSPAALDAVARTSRRAADVVRLHRAARAHLETGWYDEEDLMAAATGALGAAGTVDPGAVVVYLPQRLSLHAGRLLRRPGRQSWPEQPEIPRRRRCRGVAAPPGPPRAFAAPRGEPRRERHEHGADPHPHGLRRRGRGAGRGARRGRCRAGRDPARPHRRPPRQPGPLRSAGLRALHGRGDRDERGVRRPAQRPGGRPRAPPVARAARRRLPAGGPVRLVLRGAAPPGRAVDPRHRVGTALP